MPLSPLVSQLILWSICGGALLIAGLIKIAGRESRWEETAAPLHTHTCSRCGRVQRWTAPFDQFSPCRACQIWKPETIETEPAYERAAKRPYDDQIAGRRVKNAPELALDLDDFADADAIRVYLDSADPIRDDRPAA